MRKSNLIMGSIIIIVGIVLLLNNLNLVTIDLGNLWPIFLLIPGLMFELSYFSGGKDPGVLVPGGILTTYGILFFVNIYFGWHLMEYLWPVFPFGVAIGLFQLYLFGGRNKGTLIASSILGTLSIIFFSITIFSVNFEFVAPIVLILLGLLLMLKKKR